MVTVRTYGSRIEAEIAKGFLAANGITAFLSADDQAGLQPGMAFTHGVDLKVASGDVRSARELLDDPEGI